MRKMTNDGILRGRPASWRDWGARTVGLVAVAILATALTTGRSPASASDDQNDAAAEAKQPHAGDKIDGKRLIGATAIVVEAKTGIPFAARVDTGAQGTSLHVEEWLIDGKPEKEAKKSSIGKRIRFRIHNQNGEDDWLDGLVVDTVLVKNAEKTERRYKVVVTLKVGDFEKECIVNINDRSGMTYPILIGRNFLHGDFLVDVSMDVAVAVVNKSDQETDAKGEDNDAEEQVEGNGSDEEAVADS